ncbi:Nramp family divalent metal transporter [Streptomyces sp. NA04227]|uniref:Nramp family divalent metal transporter n=1 Tax=Streptomyces sp. NA04227 TaxID=2742136 RepID=UPI0015920483|nr:Nramp family divalent metal transporter [Streptomyces sp. NA04227]QKW10362.1 Nramp family divalent metal transporter [Streptomyces sp. NA04227]
MAQPPEPSGSAAPSFPEPPFRHFSLRGAFAVFGPGAVFASISIGGGETVFAARGGAVFGYAIIWVLVLGAILKGAIMYAGNRYAVLTGEHPMTRWARTVPGPRGWYPAVLGGLAILSFPTAAAGVSLIVGDYAASLLGGTGVLWATIMLVVCCVLSWIGGYQFLERAQTAIVGVMLAAILVSVFWARPDWLGVLGGFLPQMPKFEGWLSTSYPSVAERPVWVEVVMYMGGIGGGVFDFIGYTGLLREKKWGLLGREEVSALEARYDATPKGEYLPLPTGEKEIAKAKSWTLVPLGDVLLSSAAIVVFTAAFVINGANLLHDKQLVPADDNLLSNQASFLEVLWPGLVYLYYVAIFCAFFGTLLALWEVYSTTAHESVAALSRTVRKKGLASTRRWVYPYVLVASLLLVWTGIDPVVLLTPTSLVGGVLGVGTMAFAMVWTERKVLPPAYRMRGLGRWFLLLSGAVLTAFGVVAILQQMGVLK